MRRRGQDETDEELEGDGELVGARAEGDLGSLLSNVQEGAGNHALASLVAEVEAGDRPPEALLPGQGTDSEEETDRERKGAADRAAHMALSQRLNRAKANPFAARIDGELQAYTRRLKDAREYGWIGMDAGVLGAELDELEDKLRRAEEEDEAQKALASVDFRRKPLSERAKKAILERTAITKPGMLLYAPEDFALLDELADKLAELQKQLVENGAAVTASRQSLGELSATATLYARTAAANLADDAEKASVLLQDIETQLAELTERHARANAEDREKLSQLMEGLEPRLRREPRLAMAGGASRQEIDYLLKKAWLEQHDATQRIARDELWQIVSGFSPDEGRVCYFDLPERMGDWRIHLSLDYGVMRAVDADASESEVRDAIMGGGAGVVWRSHATAEVLGRSDDRNPRFYYGTGRVTPKKDFWSTREGKAAKHNWRHYEGELMDAFNTKADELVGLVDAVLEERRELKSAVVKVGESLQWAG